jgi:2-methylcitrate dehydratase PrpD
VNPLVLEVAAQTSPRTGLEAKFSVAFCAALGLVHGEAGEAEFAGPRLRDPAVARVMARVTPEADASLSLGAARMTVRMADGRLLEERVAAARGTADNPASHDQVEAKFHRLAEGVLPPERSARLAAMLRELANLSDVADLAAAAAPPCASA